MATYDTGKYVLQIHDDAVGSQKAQMKAHKHVQDTVTNKELTISQRIGYMFWLKTYADAFFENIYEKEQEKEGK